MPPEKMTRAEYEKKYGAPPPVKMSRVDFEKKYGYDPKDHRPSWAQSSRFVGKSFAEGLAKLVDLGPQISTLGASGSPTLDLVHQYLGKPEDEGVGGDVADYARAAVENSVNPYGGVVGNSIAGLGGVFAGHHGAPEWLGALIAGLGSSVVGSGIKSLPATLENRATRLRASALGATKSDFNKSFKAKGVLYDENGHPETALNQVIRNIHGRGWFSGSKDPHTLFTKNIETMKVFEKQLTNVLDIADKARAQKLLDVSKQATIAAQVAKKAELLAGKIQTGRNIAKMQSTAQAAKALATQQRRLQGPILNSYPLARAELNRAGDVHSPEVQDALNEIITRLGPGKNNLTLKGLQQEKRAFYNKSYGPTGEARDSIKTYVAADIKNKIENTVDDLAQQGLIHPDLANQVKNINKLYSEHLTLGKILDKAIPSSDAQVPGSTLAALTKTTPGTAAGVIGPTVAAAAAGASPVLGAMAGVGLLAGASRTGKFARAGLGDLLSNVIGKSTQIPTISNSAAPLAINALSGINSPDGSSIANLLSNVITDTPANALENTAPPKESFANLFPQENPVQQSSTQQIKQALDKQALYRAIIGQESGGNPNAVSSTGAQGLMQIMPGTAEDIAKELGVKNYDLKDPTTNQLFGQHYIDKLLPMFNNDPALALTAYHSGPGKVQELLDATGGTTLDDILSVSHEDGGLGPIGRQYAQQVLDRIPQIDTGAADIAPVQIPEAETLPPTDLSVNPLSQEEIAALSPEDQANLFNG